MSFIVIYDACVLYSTPLRDLLLENFEPLIDGLLLPDANDSRGQTN